MRKSFKQCPHLTSDNNLSNCINNEEIDDLVKDLDSIVCNNQENNQSESIPTRLMNQQNEDNPSDISTINSNNEIHMQTVNLGTRNEINPTVMLGSKISTPSIDELVPSFTDELYDMALEHANNQDNNEADQKVSLNM